MKSILMFFMLIIFSQQNFASESTIVEVRRNIPLSDEEPVYKDFYIASGSFKKNDVLTVKRKVQIRDASGAHAYGEIAIPVGQLKVISVYDKVSVAREHKLFSRDELPMIDQPGIQNGDLVEH